MAFHIATGAVALLAGAAALSYRKGSRRHRSAGIAFALSMFAMAASGTWLAYAIPVRLSIIGGLLTIYLVATGWTTVARRTPRPGAFELGAFLVALSIGSSSVAFGFEALNSDTGLRDGFPPGQYFFFGTVAFLAAAGDLKLRLFGGASGAGRIARHLWRVCFALFIAASAFFLGQARLFPAAVRETPLLWILGFGPLLVMAYWLVRVLLRRTRTGAERRSPRSPPTRRRPAGSPSATARGP